MLRKLSGRSHSVFTGVTIIIKDTSTGDTITKNCETSLSFYEETKVNVYPVSEEEISEYINSKEPMDKAGAYGVQGKFAPYIKSLEGDYYNVVGLPIARLYQELKKLGYDLHKM